MCVTLSPTAPPKPFVHSILSDAPVMLILAWFDADAARGIECLSLHAHVRLGYTGPVNGTSLHFGPIVS